MSLAQDHRADKWEWGGVVVVCWAICLPWVFPACIPPRTRNGWTVQYGWRREGNAYQVRGSFHWLHFLERWVRISWGLVSVQETQTAPEAGPGAVLPLPALLSPALSDSGGGWFSQKGQVGWGWGEDRSAQASGSSFEIILTWDQARWAAGWGCAAQS